MANITFLSFRHATALNPASRAAVTILVAAATGAVTVELSTADLYSAQTATDALNAKLAAAGAGVRGTVFIASRVAQVADTAGVIFTLWGTSIGLSTTVAVNGSIKVLDFDPSEISFAGPSARFSSFRFEIGRSSEWYSIGLAGVGYNYKFDRASMSSGSVIYESNTVQLSEFTPVSPTPEQAYFGIGTHYFDDGVYLVHAITPSLPSVVSHFPNSSALAPNVTFVVPAASAASITALEFAAAFTDSSFRATLGVGTAGGGDSTAAAPKDNASLKIVGGLAAAALIGKALLGGATAKTASSGKQRVRAMQPQPTGQAIIGDGTL